MKVMEVYAAPQGEGQYIGQPSVFVRFFGCNLRCAWCDTAYSINAKEFNTAGIEGEMYTEYTPEELCEFLRLQDRDHIVLTGGEPTIQPEFVDLLELLYSAGFLVTVETNGTILPEGLKEWYKKSWDKFSLLWSVSPKSAFSSASFGSAGHLGRGRTWVDLTVVQWYLAQARSQLKFVISTYGDFQQAERMVAGLDFTAYKTPIIFQPEGSIINQGADAYLTYLTSMQKHVIADWYWQAFDVRVLPQLHTLLHGQKRFV